MLFRSILYSDLNNKESNFCKVSKNNPWDKADLSRKILSDVKDIINKDKKGSFSYNISNTDRSVGANVSGEIASRYGEDGLSGSLNLNFMGSAGQSFGCWNANGLNITLNGDANDYVGKGMNGGKIIIKNDADFAINDEKTILAGNTCLYGATGGEVYISGSVGERFAVRNSGAKAVIEGEIGRAHV